MRFCLVGEVTTSSDSGRWGESYATLQPRITKTLVHAFLDTAKPLATHYGAIKGLTMLGRYTIQLLILPNIPPYAAVSFPSSLFSLD